MWINEVKVGGVLFRKFELKTSGTGKHFINFTIKSTKEKKTQFTPCVAFGDFAKVIDDLQPESYLTIEGEISTSGVDNKQTGKKDYRTSVIAHKLTTG